MNGKKDSDNQNSEHSKKKWILPALCLVGLAIVACIYWCPPNPPDLATMLAEEFDADPNFLSLNLPPRPDRYPGTTLLAPYDIFLKSVKSTDMALNRGSLHEFTRQFSGTSEGKSKSIGNMFQIVANSQAKVDFEFKSTNSSVVEREELLKHVENLALAEDIKEGAPANVIYRSFEGKLVMTVKRHRTLFGGMDAWNELVDDLKSGGIDTVAFEINLEEEDEVRFEFSEPIVFAFEACSAESLLNFGTLRKVAPTVAVTDPKKAVQSLMKIDPLALEDVSETLREIGPGVGDAVQDAMRSNAPWAKERGEVLLRNLPTQFRPKLNNPQTSIKDPDPSVRTWSVLQLSDSASDSDIQILARALRDDDPTVRFLASQSLGELGSRANVAAPALKDATKDSNPDVRLSAEASLIVVEAGQGQETIAVENAITAPDAVSRVAAVTVMGNHFLPVNKSLPLLKQSLADPDLSVQMEALKSIGKLGPAAKPLIPDVKRLLGSKNPNIRRAARLALGRIRQGG